MEIYIILFLLLGLISIISAVMESEGLFAFIGVLFVIVGILMASYIKQTASIKSEGIRLAPTTYQELKIQTTSSGVDFVEVEGEFNNLNKLFEKGFDKEDKVFLKITEKFTYKGLEIPPTKELVLEKNELEKK